VGLITWKVEESIGDDDAGDDDDDKSDEYLSGVYVFWSTGVSFMDGKIVRGWWNTTTETVWCSWVSFILDSCLC
jgi:hypothetical protein